MSSAENVAGEVDWSVLVPLRQLQVERGSGLRCPKIHQNAGDVMVWKVRTT